MRPEGSADLPGWRNWSDTAGLNAAVRKGVWVRVPPRAPIRAGHGVWHATLRVFQRIARSLSRSALAALSRVTKFAPVARYVPRAGK